MSHSSEKWSGTSFRKERQKSQGKVLEFSLFYPLKHIRHIEEQWKIKKLRHVEYLSHILLKNVIKKFVWLKAIHIPVIYTQYKTINTKIFFKSPESVCILTDMGTT